MGGFELLSQERVTQGCPFLMAMYALATLPLLNLLRPANNRDERDWMPRPDIAGGMEDGQGGGSLEQVFALWNRVLRFGPGFGYYPKPAKTTLIVKKDKVDAAKDLFKDSKVEILKEGHRDLGAFIETRVVASTLLARMTRR